MSASLERFICLKSVPLFSSLPTPILTQVANLLVEIHVKAGEVIFEQNAPGDCLYIIVEGSVQVHQGTRVINRIGEFNVFGEMALLDSEPRMASVTADADSRLFRLDQAAFYDLLERHPEVSRGIIQILSRHLRARVRDLMRVTEDLEAMANGTLPARTDMVGSFQLKERIGRGGMGEVYRGYHQALDRQAAVKILWRDLASTLDFRERFEREARIVAQLNHPNIVQVYDCGEHRDTYYIAMEFLDGVTLEEYLRQHGALSFAETVALLSEVAAALDYAHNQHLVHRDVTPANIMLVSGENRRVVLMDFGISKVLGRGAPETSGDLTGTVHYMSPEQVISPNEVDHRVDIYALGVVAYRMITGELPFESSTPYELLLKHVSASPPPPSQHREGIPPMMEAAIMRCLMKDPADRYDSAGTFAETLRSSL